MRKSERVELMKCHWTRRGLWEAMSS